LIWPILVFFSLAGGLAYCIKNDFRCDVTSESELPSPDGRYVAVERETICVAGLGINTSVGKRVLINTRPPGRSSEAEIFITFDTPPTVRWLANDLLEITVNAVNAINVSQSSAKGVRIAYRLHDGLTEAVIRDQLAAEQRRMKEYFKDSRTVEKLNANAQQRFEAFIRWAKEHGALSP
jgi:hypothetical protein